MFFEIFFVFLEKPHIDSENPIECKDNTGNKNSPLFIGKRGDKPEWL